MATVVNYSPLTKIGKALFNFGEMELVNFKLTGEIRVSVSNNFSYNNFLSGTISDSDIYNDYSITWTSSQIDNLNSILNSYSQFTQLQLGSVINLNHLIPSQTRQSSDINISIISRPDADWAGVSSINENFYGYPGSELDIVLNIAGFGNEDSTFNNDTYGFHTLMHEIGHSLGLSHPHVDYEEGVATLSNHFSALTDVGFEQLGFVINSAQDLYKDYFTIMSYDDSASKTNAQNPFAQTPMILDVIALIEAYGEGDGTALNNNTVTPGADGSVSAYRTYFNTDQNTTVSLANYSAGAYFNMGVTIEGARYPVGVSMSMTNYQKVLQANTPESLRWFYGHYANAIGSSRHDFIIGNDLNNDIQGIAGDDTLDGGLGNDSLTGGLGNDIFIIDSGEDLISDLGNGVDQLNIGFDGSLEATVVGHFVAKNTTSNDGEATLYSNGFNLDLRASQGTSGYTLVNSNQKSIRIQGSKFDDVLISGPNKDSLSGGLGDDQYQLQMNLNGGLNSKITENNNGGTDEVIILGGYTGTKAITFTIAKNFEHIDLTETQTSLINVNGNALDNQIIGNDGINFLNGRLGDDTLSGGLAADVLTGGKGEDFFVFNTTLNLQNIDTITDFSIEDGIILDDSIFSVLSLNNWQSNNFRVGNQANDLDDYIIYDNESGKLYFDSDGSGVGIMQQFAQLMGNPSLSFNSITVI